jgi:hypothetical protein
MDMSVSSVNGTASSLMMQAVGMPRAVNSVQATQATTRSSQQTSTGTFENDGEDSSSWADGLGDRFATDTANSLLDAQGTTTQADQTYYFDPLDTNKDGKVTYYEWLAGQKSSTDTSTAATASSGAGSTSGTVPATETSLAA